jgi:hypothetical protein
MEGGPWPSGLACALRPTPLEADRGLMQDASWMIVGSLLACQATNRGLSLELPPQYIRPESMGHDRGRDQYRRRRGRYDTKGHDEIRTIEHSRTINGHHRHDHDPPSHRHPRQWHGLVQSINLYFGITFGINDEPSRNDSMAYYTIGLRDSNTYARTKTVACSTPLVVRAGAFRSATRTFKNLFVLFVSFCSKTRPTPCTRYLPELTRSPDRSLAPPSKCTGSWGQDCWRASTSGA